MEIEQQITSGQFKELPDVQREIVIDWSIEHNYPILLTIGQIIEFIIEHDTGELHAAMKKIKSWWDSTDQGKNISPAASTNEHEKPCDATLRDGLWEAVKETLDTN